MSIAQRQLDRALRTMTLVTFDAEAGLGYVYFESPVGCGAVGSSDVVSIEGDDSDRFNCTLDRALMDGRSLGVEFAAKDRAQALRRAAAILGALG